MSPILDKPEKEAGKPWLIWTIVIVAAVVIAVAIVIDVATGQTTMH